MRDFATNHSVDRVLRINYSEPHDETELEDGDQAKYRSRTERRIYYGIDVVASGRNISRLRQERGLEIRDIQECMGLDSPRAIYKWEDGSNLPSLEHLRTLALLYDLAIEDILVWI